VTESSISPSGVIAVVIGDIPTAERRLVEVLAASGERVVSISPESTSLEEVFLEVTK
jgi:hypothetical protein